MTPERFNLILEERIAKMRDVLASKSKEYSTSTDKLYNFTEGCEMAGQTPKAYLWCLLTKHLMCVRDMAYDKLSPSYTDEKIGDAISYLVLLEALLIEENCGISITSTYEDLRQPQ